jgi:serine protease Do
MELDDFKRRKRPSLFGYFIAALTGEIFGGFLLLTFGPAALFAKFQPPSPQASPSPVQPQQVVVERTDDTDISAASAKVMPSVVGIVTTKIERDLFSQSKRVQGVGSGIIVDSSGYILTNNHVVGLNSRDITVSLSDGRNVKARPIWSDPVLDLSIIKIDVDKITPAVLGDSKLVKVGQQAIAIGNPLGLTFQRTVTAGIISAINRTIEVDRGVFMEDLIQTDASINPGNSGGPLINIRGEVVGVNTIKVTTAEGMGFAIPINIVKPIIKSIVATGKFTTPSLGISGFDREIAGYYNYRIDTGVFVYDVDRGGPAYKAGIKQGDVILSINGKTINTMVDLKEALYNAGVGNTVTIKVLTQMGDQKDVQATLEPIV